MKSFIKLAKEEKKIQLILIGENGWGFKIKNKAVDFYTFLESIKIPEDIKKRIFLFPNIKDRQTLQKLISIRKKHAAFHPNSKQEILDFGNEIFGLKRTADNGEEIILIINLIPDIK